MGLQASFCKECIGSCGAFWLKHDPNWLNVNFWFAGSASVTCRMLAVPGVDFAVHTDRPILSTGAYLDFKRHVGNLLEQGNHGKARMLWLSAVEVLHAPFVQAPLPLVDSGEIPHLQFAPCIDAQCARCDGSLGGFKFPFIGTWCRRAVLVQEGASAEKAWAAYHGCYEEDRLFEAMVAEAGSGLRPGHPDVCLRHCGPGGIWRPPLRVLQGLHGDLEEMELGRSEVDRAMVQGERLPGQSHSGEASPWVAGGTSLWAGFAPTAEAGLTLCALHVASINAKPAPSAAAKALRWGALLLAMAFRGDATPGRYATEAMEHSGATRAALAKG